MKIFIAIQILVDIIFIWRFSSISTDLLDYEIFVESMYSFKDETNIAIEKLTRVLTTGQRELFYLLNCSVCNALLPKDAIIPICKQCKIDIGEMYHGNLY